MVQFERTASSPLVSKRSVLRQEIQKGVQSGQSSASFLVVGALLGREKVQKKVARRFACLEMKLNVGLEFFFLDTAF